MTSNQYVYVKFLANTWKSAKPFEENCSTNHTC